MFYFVQILTKRVELINIRNRLVTWNDGLIIMSKFLEFSLYFNHSHAFTPFTLPFSLSPPPFPTPLSLLSLYLSLSLPLSSRILAHSFSNKLKFLFSLIELNPLLAGRWTGVHSTFFCGHDPITQILLYSNSLCYSLLLPLICYYRHQFNMAHSQFVSQLPWI